jgi:hypothetical protein
MTLFQHAFADDGIIPLEEPGIWSEFDTFFVNEPLWSNGTPPNTTISIGNGVRLYEDAGRWGIAQRGDDGRPCSAIEPSFDAIYVLGRAGFVARDGNEWCHIDGSIQRPSRTFPSLEAVIRHIHSQRSFDAFKYEEARNAIRPEQILWEVPNGGWLVFQQGDKWGIGDGRNRFTTFGQVVPYLSFDSDEIAIFTSDVLGEAAFIGKIGDRWSIHCTSNGNCGDYDTFDEAIDGWKTRSVEESPYDRAGTIRVDEFGKRFGNSGLALFRVGSRWGIGHRAGVMYRLPVHRREEFVVPFAGWFASDDIEMVRDYSEGPNHHRIVGKVEAGWIAFDELGRCYGHYDTADDAWKSFDEARDRTQEPLPAGMDETDFPYCLSRHGPSIGDVELEQARIERGEEPEFEYEFDSDIRLDEGKLEALKLPDFAEQLPVSTNDLMALDEIAPNPSEPSNLRTNQCPVELQPFIDLTPKADYGCCLPVTWLVEFLQLKDGDSCSKHGFAWFYGPPHDREECVYRASVVDGVLRVEVEVGPEVLTRRANFQLFSVAPDVERKGAE